MTVGYEKYKVNYTVLTDAQNNEFKTKIMTETSTNKTKTKTSKMCLKTVLRRDTVSRLNITVSRCAVDNKRQANMLRVFL